ncbi:MAG: hypothetical protein QOE33_1790 [Acidobacteriota bacterium]|nr:hypothetical protein [Acidobacteriota bacterium]
MQTNRQVRVIKREQRESNRDNAAPVAIRADNTGPTERDMRAVVSGWVREHREGVGDYRRALTTLFARLDAGTPRVA